MIDRLFVIPVDHRDSDAQSLFVHWLDRRPSIVIRVIAFDAFVIFRIGTATHGVK